MSKCAKCGSNLVEDSESKILRCSKCEEYHVGFMTIVNLRNAWSNVLDKTNEILGKINVLLEVLPKKNANRIEIRAMYEKLTTTVIKSLQSKIRELFESLFPSFLVEASRRFTELSNQLENNEIGLKRILKKLPEEIYYDYKATLTKKRFPKVENVEHNLHIYEICISAHGKNLINKIYEKFENQEKKLKHELMTGLFHAVRSFCEEAYHRSLDDFKAGNYTIVFASWDMITDKNKKEKLVGYALIDNGENIDRETIEEIRQKIKYALVQFSEKFKGRNLENTSKFIPFESIIEEIFDKKRCDTNAKRIKKQN